MLSRRTFLVASATGVVTLYLSGATGERVALAQSLVPDLLDAGCIPQFRTPLPQPPVMRRTRRARTRDGLADCYEVGVRRVRQQMLPAGYPRTSVFAYGPAAGPDADFATPGATFETTTGVPVQVRWVNQLVDHARRPVPHLLAVDPTLHWANPERRPGHMGPVTDSKPDFAGLTYVAPEDYCDPSTQYTAYRGPVPTVAHLHGAVGVGDESDGYPEAWVLPDTDGVDPRYARHGRWFDFFSRKAARTLGLTWGRGEQVCHYPNRNAASTLWYHDHALGLTRLNVYAGMAGFYLVRDQEPRETGRRGTVAVPSGLPGSPTSHGQGHREHELLLCIQDRSFRRDGSLYYPDTRADFDDYSGPFVPRTPVPPIWNPEVFGNTLVVNGVVWPFTTLERRRYRIRVLNGCGSRALILDLGAIPGARCWQIGGDAGYLPAPVDLARQGGHLTLAPAERADLVLDLTGTPVGRYVVHNLGPDEPYGGGPVGSFEGPDGATTGRVLQIRVVPRVGEDRSVPGDRLRLPAPPALPRSCRTRRVALMEHSHSFTDGDDGPVMAMLGVLSSAGGSTTAKALSWMDPVTENPAPGDTETWEIYNFTEDAHPVHVHEVAFQVLGRAPFALEDGRLTTGPGRGPEPGERGRKDTVVAAPGEVTRIAMTFSRAGQYVWHCHVLEHEDNEMMRPYRIGPVQPGQPLM